MSRMKVAIVGAGWVTQHCYLPHLGPDSRLEVVSVYDPDRERARRVANALGLSRPAQDFAECLDSSIQGVIICTPTQTHLPLLLRCLEAEKYVLCEKPVVCDEDGIEALRAMPVAAKRLMGSATTRLRRDVELLLSWVQSGRIGHLRRMRLGWWRGMGVPASESWRIDPQTCPTGVLEDLGPHLLDIAAALLPTAVATRPERVASVLECRYGTAGRVAEWYGNNGKKSAPDYAVPDYARAAIDFPGDPVLEFEACWMSDDEGDASQIVFEGTQGVASLQGLFGYSTSRREPHQSCSLEVKGHSTEVVEFIPGPEEQRAAFGKSVETFAQFCAGEAPPIADLQEVLTVAFWLAAIRQNALLSPVAGVLM